MPRMKSKREDAASQNKKRFIEENYLLKEQQVQKPPLKGKPIIIASLSFVLLLLVAATFYWSYFLKPQPQQPALQVQETTSPHTAAPEITSAPVTPKPTPAFTKYDEYKEVYTDIVGWISIDNIKVDYPVMQSPDHLNPFKYLALGPDEQKSKYGAIFLDIRNSPAADDRHTILYGHNMRDGSMFGQLDMYLKREFFNDHLTIQYDTMYQELEWEVFNVFITTTDFYYIETYFKSDEDFVNLMTKCVYKSYYRDNQMVITPEDRVLTLSTCTSGPTNERLVVQARLITPLEPVGKEINQTDSSAFD